MIRKWIHFSKIIRLFLPEKWIFYKKTSEKQNFTKCLNLFERIFILSILLTQSVYHEKFSMNSLSTWVIYQKTSISHRVRNIGNGMKIIESFEEYPLGFVEKFKLFKSWLIFSIKIRKLTNFLPNSYISRPKNEGILFNFSKILDIALSKSQENIGIFTVS